MTKHFACARPAPFKVESEGNTKIPHTHIHTHMGWHTHTQHSTIGVLHFWWIVHSNIRYAFIVLRLYDTIFCTYFPMDSVPRTPNHSIQLRLYASLSYIVSLQWTASSKLEDIESLCVSVCTREPRGLHTAGYDYRVKAQSRSKHAAPRHTPLYERVLGSLMQTAATLHMCNITAECEY